MSLCYWADWILLLWGSGKTSLESERKEICLKFWILSLSMNIEELLTPTRSYIYEVPSPIFSALWKERLCIFRSIPWTYRFFLKLHCLIKITLSCLSFHFPSNTKSATATAANVIPSQREPASSRIGLATWMGFQQKAKDGANLFCPDIKTLPYFPVTIHNMRTWTSGSFRIQMGRKSIPWEAITSWMLDLCDYVGYCFGKNSTLSLLCYYCFELNNFLKRSPIFLFCSRFFTFYSQLYPLWEVMFK